MDNRLLREYVSLLVEAIRTKKGVKSKMGSKFDLDKFKKLDNYRAMLEYAKTYLQKMGQGSSRAAFLLSSKYVLKIAVNKKGIAQNQAELDVYTSPDSKPVVAKVYSADDAYNWLISDLVNPLSDPKEFEQLTGLNFEQFTESLREGMRENTSEGTKGLLKATLDTANKCDLMFGDLEEISHWGKTPDGRCVLLDYGFTGEVWEGHYSPAASQREKEQAAVTKKDQADLAPSVRSPYTSMATDKTIASPASPYEKTAVAPGAMSAKTVKHGKGGAAAPEAGRTEKEPEKTVKHGK